jgi:hypothetical protein
MADNAKSLITVADYELYAGVTIAAGVRPQYEGLAMNVTKALEMFWHRTIIAATYRQELYDGGSDMLFLRNYPVTDVSLVAVGLTWMIRALYVPTTVYNAYVSVSTTGVKLVVDGVAGVEKTFAANPTMAAMVAALQTANWTIEIASSLYNNFPSNQLLEAVNATALGAGAFLSIPGDPVSGYVVDKEIGTILYPPGFPEGESNVAVSYTAGYANTASVPEDMKLVALQLLDATLSNRGQDVAMKSESMGDYSYTVADVQSGFDSDIRQAAFPFKRILIR